MAFEPRPVPYAGDERATLVGLLDLHRAILPWKLEGLGEDEVRRTVVGSETTLLGLVKHMAYVETWWFLEYIDGQQPDLQFSRDDPDAEFRIDPDDTIGSIVALYEQQIEAANEVIARRSLDDVGDELRGNDARSLRWVLVHMIEETARHCGHADIIRELTDGRTGYLPPKP